MIAPKNIVITGASSGIGEALAESYAAPGMTIAISGRDSPRLSMVAEKLRQKGCEVHSQVIDVGDREAMRTWINRLDNEHPLDLVIANAGIDGSSSTGDDIYFEVARINYLGVLNTVLPAITHMKTRGNGQLAIVSSLAGFRGLPSAVAYAASKAAVRSLGEGLRGRLQEHGVNVAVVCPGFVESRITADNKFPMPMLWSAEKAAHYIKRKLAKNKGRIVFPWPMYASVWLINAMPSAWADRLLAKAPKKQ